MRKLKKNDEVIVLTGKYKGKQGKLLKVLEKGRRFLVEGVTVKKHVRPNPQANEKGGIVDIDAPIQHSNVAIYNPATKKADRVGIRTLEDGRKVRYFKSNDELIDV